MYTITRDTTQFPYLFANRNLEHNIDYFNDFLHALLNVKEAFLVWQYGISQQTSERVFAYELYHQWRLYTHNFPSYRDLLINGEVRKNGSILRNPDFAVSFPDLVLHGNQNDTASQIAICEIKTTRALIHDSGLSSMKKDLFKLASYQHYLHFEYPIFIQILDYEDCFQQRVVPYLKRNAHHFVDKRDVIYVIKKHECIMYSTIGRIIDL
jgi:hypothetical protein